MTSGGETSRSRGTLADRARGCEGAGLASDLACEPVGHAPRHLVCDPTDPLEACHPEESAIRSRGNPQVYRGAWEEVLGMRAELLEEKGLPLRGRAAGGHEPAAHLVLRRDRVHLAWARLRGVEDGLHEGADGRSRDEVLEEEHLGHEAAVRRLGTVQEPALGDLEQSFPVGQAR
jgi:hypothetical protein